RRRQAELDRVRRPDGFVDVVRPDERGRRPEALLLRAPHLGIDLPEDGRPVEEALVETVLRRDLATGQELRPLALADLGVRVDLVERSAVDDRTDVDVLLEAVAELELLRALDELRLERLVDLRPDDDAARGGAALARRAERGPEDPVDGEIDVGVVHHDDRVLAAELE